MLREALDAYKGVASPFYDEVLYEVSERAARRGSIGKADIGALIAWKRLNANTRWVAALMGTSEETVRGATSAAYAAARREASLPTAAGAARSALSTLPGFGVGDALASAVIVALAPDRMAVYDRRAQLGLERLGCTLTREPGRYSRYMALVEQLANDTKQVGMPLSAREVDLALYTLGRA